MEAHAPIGRWGHSAHGLDARTRAFAELVLGPASSAPMPTMQAVAPAREPGCAWGHVAPGVRIDATDEVRAAHSRGMSYLDLLAWRGANGASGALLPAVDAVAFPTSHEQALAVVQGCASEGVVVVPVGGGTSVTGGIDAGAGAATSGDDRPVLAVSLAELDALTHLDTESHIATVQAGMTGPQVEQALDGYTLGHFPQSWERATIGGFIAARSSGQSSGGYGRIEDMLIGATLATPAGTWKVGGYPAASMGPDLRHVVLGSEGTLGVITSAQLRVRPMPSVREYAAAIVPLPRTERGAELSADPSFAPASDVARALTRSPLRPTVLRVSDAGETQALLTMSAPAGIAGSLFNAYVRARRALPGALVIVGWEGNDPGTVGAARAFARSVIGDAGGVWLGSGPGRSWERGRFHGPYLRDELMDAGYLVETFETVVRWSELAELHATLRDVARRALGDASYVMAHISHTYETGASIYFTVLAGGWSDPAAAAQRWRAAKQTITKAMVRAGGALSHHHGIGRDHAPWLEENIGPIGVRVLEGIRTAVDPSGVMNPSVLRAVT